MRIPKVSLVNLATKGAIIMVLVLAPLLRFCSRINTRFSSSLRRILSDVFGLRALVS
jgi:hypothetical protein